MANLQAIKDTLAEQRIFLGRLFVAVVFVLLASGVVVARLTQLQIIEHEHYADLSQGNRIRIEAAPPTLPTRRARRFSTAFAAARPSTP